MLSKVMAGCLALAAFAVAIIAGLAADNAAGLVLMRALMAMFVCYPVGFVVGMICERVIAMHVEELSAEQVQAAAAQPAATAGDAGDDGESEEEVLTV